MNDPSFVAVRGGRVEYRYFEPLRTSRDDRTLVMLHEGLGSVAMWKQFPARLAAATGLRVVAYSRFGYGQSDVAPERVGALEMHETEALKVLPDVLRGLGIERPVLLGHSDGASIALIYAGAVPEAVSHVIALAPHVFVEERCIAAIEEARSTIHESDLTQRLARYHQDPERVFWSWNTAWLTPAFRQWNIEGYLSSIQCPVLAIQGYQDEYGTFEQLNRISRAVARTTILKLPDCRHSPHRDQPDMVLSAITQFLRAASLNCV